MKQLTITTRLTNRETDSFKQYLKDIAEIDMFTTEEEFICTKKMSEGDVEAKNELIRRNLRFVVSVAKQYATKDNPLEDLVNEGNIGLMIAADKFMPDKGFKFISYAVYWIQKIIMEHLSNHGRMVRLPANKINRLSKLDKKVSSLEQKLGRSVDIQEVIDECLEDTDIEAGKLETDDFELLDVLSTYHMDSLDREVSGEDDKFHTTLGDLISDDTTFKPTDHLIIDTNIKAEVAKIMDTLKPRDKRIMVALFGLDGNTPMTLKEVSDEIGVTREMIRQIKEKTLLSLKIKLKNSTIRSCQ